MSELSSLNYSALESQRFGLKVFRGILLDITTQSLLELLLQNSVDLAILRFPSNQLRKMSLLNELGIPIILADTLVYYYLDLEGFKPKPLRNRKLSYIMTNPEHVAALDDLTQQIFEGYNSHYSSNPILPKESILAGYQEWSRSYITDHDTGRISWLVKNGDSFIAFAACSYSLIDKECEIVLNGVVPEASGKGIYTDLIRHMQQFFVNNRIKTMRVSTQIHNSTVQKVWANEGFILKESYNTVHINSFLSKSLYPQKKLCGDVEVINSYTNPNFVREVVNSLVAEPNANVQVKSYSAIIIKPFANNVSYAATFSFPFVNINDGHYKVLLKILDECDDLCSLIYYDCWRG